MRTLSPPSAESCVGPSAILIAWVFLDVGPQVETRAAFRWDQTALGGVLVLAVGGGLHRLRYCERLSELGGRDLRGFCAVMALSVLYFVGGLACVAHN